MLLSGSGGGVGVGVRRALNWRPSSLTVENRLHE